MMRSPPCRSPYPQLGLARIFITFPTFFGDLFSTRHDGGFETFGVFPSRRGEIGIGFIRVFDKGLSRLPKFASIVSTVIITDPIRLTLAK
jgi:hypothetical protein